MEMNLDAAYAAAIESVTQAESVLGSSADSTDLAMTAVRAALPHLEIQMRAKFAAEIEQAADFDDGTYQDADEKRQTQYVRSGMRAASGIIFPIAERLKYEQTT